MFFNESYYFQKGVIICQKNGVNFKKKQHTLDDNSEFSDDFEDEDFDLDSDLEPVTQRSYVSLNQETEETPAEEETSSEQDAEV